ncbi:phage tail tape measure protein [Janthinobacterium sp. FT14W]|uniref:phage tail tape measure protein n=1 Tax=Janthinobacterium sp. FT14W TaxID=2654253 RepID=UPI001D0351DB|nr:phage tail protein [Janthinobacterium sp. FT14W]
MFAALDKITGPLKKIMGGSSDTAKALKATSDRLRELNNQQRNLGKFRELHSGIGTTRADLKKAQDALNALAAKMKQTETPTRAMTRDFNAAVKVTQALTLKSREQSQQFRVLRTSLKDAGIDTRQLGKAQEWLKNSIQLTNVELASQQKRLAASAAKQQRVTNATQHADKLRSKAGNIATAGAGATAAGAVMAMPIAKGLHEAKHYQLEKARVNALGLGPKTSQQAIQFAQNMKTYGTSQNENLELVRDAMSIFGDLHHAEMVAPTLAKMKFANKAFFGKESGEENERIFMDLLKVIEQRGGTASSEKFHDQANMMQKVITATGGRVGPTEWLNFIKTGGIAAKIMDDKQFYYQMEPLVQEVGGHRAGTALMSGYSNLYQGRTTKRAVTNLENLGLIGDHSKVKHDKVGQVSTLGPGALLGSDIFRRSQFEWLEQVLLPQLEKKGITDPKKIEDTIGSLFSTRTAGNQFLDMFRQRIQMHKNAKLNAGAYDIEQIYDLGKQQAGGAELEATARLANLKLTMGEKILPLYAQGLEMAINAITRLNGFMERNPTVAKVMIAGFAGLASLLLVLGPLMLGIAALIGPYAMLHVMFAKMGVTGGVLTPILRNLGGAFMWAGRAVLWLGRALFLNPIGIAVTLIAGAAYLIYKNWEPIKAFFVDIWSQVKVAFAGGLVGVHNLILNWSPLGVFYKAFAGVLGWFGIELPAQFTEFGANILRGLVNGITGSMGAVKDAISNAGSSTIAWFKEKLGIHSPSRVFAQLGDYTMQGLAVGLDRSEGAPIAKVSGLAQRLTQLGAGIAIGTATALPASAFDTRAPLPVGGFGAGMTIQGDKIEITFHVQAGTDPQAIARAVSVALDQRDREKAARIRSSLRDHD